MSFNRLKFLRIVVWSLFLVLFCVLLCGFFLLGVDLVLIVCMCCFTSLCFGWVLDDLVDSGRLE